MVKQIANLSPQAVIEAIERNLADSSTAMGRGEDGVVFRGSDVTWIYTGFPSLSRVLDAKFPLEEAEDRIAEILGFFKQWDASVMWVIGPSSFPPRLSEMLHDGGFGPMELWTGMAMDLKFLPSSVDVPDNIKIREVTDDAGLAKWASLLPYSARGTDGEPSVQMLSSLMAAREAGSRYYLAYHDEKPVARSMAFKRKDVVGLYWTNAEEGVLSKQIELALAHRALNDGQSAGAKIAAVPAPVSHESTYAELGFQPYCQFHVYAWPPAPIRMPMA